MMSLNDKLSRVKNALTPLSDKVYHYKRPADIAGAILWAEDAEDGSFHAGNHLAEQQIHGTVDYYTKVEFDPMCDSIQGALESSRIPWDLSSVQYEDETGLIHFEWDFWVS